MKKTIIPSKGVFITSIGAFLLDVVFIVAGTAVNFWYTPIMVIKELVFKDPGVFNIIMALGEIIMVWGLLPGLIIYLAFGSFQYFFLGCRPLKISDDKISIGYIKKSLYEKKNITAVGIAPILAGRLVKAVDRLPMGESQGIYIAFGNCKRSDFADYGIAFVWEMVEFIRMFPKLTTLESRISGKAHKIDPSKIHPFDGLVWMSYTEENMRFLKEWMGDRFEEVV